MTRKSYTSLRRSIFTVCIPIFMLSLVGCNQEEVEESDVPCGQEGHIHAVDLGLSVKWAYSIRDTGTYGSLYLGMDLYQRS